MARDGDGEGILFTVFVDTSLDTHLATTVSDSETVSDLKRCRNEGSAKHDELIKRTNGLHFFSSANKKEYQRKITLEHGQAVPATGDVKVHSLKVKCGEIYYHLPESMPVKRAFRACTEEDWFLSADVSHVMPGSPSKHSMIVSNVKQKVPKFPGDDSRRKASKNDEGERPSHHKERKLKKRRRHESNVADGEHEKRRKKDKIPQAADLDVAVQKNCNELVREANTGFQIPSSSIIRTCGCEHEDERLVKHDEDPVVDLSSTIPAPVTDEKLNDEQTKDNMIVKEVKIKEATESRVSRVRKENSRKEMKDTARRSGMKKKDDVGKSSKMKQVNIDAATGENEEKLIEKLDGTKKKKTKKISTARIGATDEKIAYGDKIISKKDSHIFYCGLVNEAKKNLKSSTTESEPEKSKIREEPLKNLTTDSQVCKGDDGDIPKEGSHGIDFSPGQQQPAAVDIKIHELTAVDTKLLVKEKQLKKKSKEQDDSKNGTSVANEKVLLSSKKVSEVSTDGVGVKDQNAPDISKTKTPETTTKIDTLKTTKPCCSVDTVGEGVPGVESLLNTPETVFGDDSDDDDEDNVNSDSSTYTPSSVESDISLDKKNYEFRLVKRKQVDEKRNMNSQSGPENISYRDRLRSSSTFKK